MTMMEERIGRSGNPFVDWGLSVATAMVGINGVDDLTYAILAKLIEENGERIAGQHQSLKSFMPIFGSNTPLHNPKPKGQRPGRQHVEKYVASVLRPLAAILGRTTAGPTCEACGRRSGVPASQIGSEFLGRDWFPLAGAKTEANCLPAASRSATFCPVCLLAVRLIPSAALLVNGRMMVLQSSPPDFAEAFAREVYDHVQPRYQAGDVETEGRKEGTKAFARRMLALFDRLDREKRNSVVGTGTRLFAWYFSNAGAEPDVEFEEIPNRTLSFLQVAVHRGLRREIEGLLLTEKKETDFNPGFLRCVTIGRDYGLLYAHGKHPGASLDLFELYQIRVVGRRPKTLRAARLLGERLLAGIKNKNAREALCKPDALYDLEHRARARRIMVEQALEGAFSLEDYRDIFCRAADSSSNGCSTAIEHTAWKLIAFYLGQVNHSPSAGVANSAAVLDATDSTILDPIDVTTQVADRMLDRLLSIRAPEWIRGAILRDFSPSWFNTQYLQCARVKEGFTFERWLRLSFDPAGRYSPWESLYQVRLGMASRLSTGPKPTGEAGGDDIQTGIFDGAELPMALTEMMGSYLSRYLRDRGSKRLERDIVNRWMRGEIGFDWLGTRLRQAAAEADDARTALESWLSQPPPAGRWVQKHQLGLALVNAARRLSSASASANEQMEEQK